MPFWRKAPMWSLLFPLPGLLCFSLIPSGTALILAFEFAVALTRECLRSCAILKHTKHCTFECLVFSSIFNSELSFTASLYKGQVSNPRISWVKQPSGCCTSSLAIYFIKLLEFYFPNLFLTFRIFIIKSLEFPGWVTDFVLQRCCHAAALCCFTSTHSPPSFPGICVEQERWRGLMLHNCDRSSWLSSSTDNLVMNTFQIFS